MQTFRLSTRPPRHQHSTPRLPQYIIVVLNSEVMDEVVEFGHEELFRPELFILVLLGEMGRLSPAKLVVEDDDGARVGQVCDGEKVVVAHPRSAVYHDEGTLCRLLEITEDLAVRKAFLVYTRRMEWDLDFLRCDWHGCKSL